MSVFIVSGSNAPEPTHLVIGQFKKTTGEEATLEIDVDAIQDPAKKAVYNAFFNFVGSYVSVEIINSPYQLDCNHITPLPVELDAIVLDYNTITAAEKEKIDNAFALLETL